MVQALRPLLLTALVTAGCSASGRKVTTVAPTGPQCKAGEVRVGNECRVDTGTGVGTKPPAETTLPEARPVAEVKPPEETAPTEPVATEASTKPPVTFGTGAGDTKPDKKPDATKPDATKPDAGTKPDDKKPDATKPGSGTTGNTGATNGTTGTTTAGTETLSNGPGTLTNATTNAATNGTTTAATGQTGATATFVNAPVAASDGAPHVKLVATIADRKLLVYAALSHKDKVADFTFNYGRDKYNVTGQTVTTGGGFSANNVEIPVQVTFTFDGRRCRVATSAGFTEKTFKPDCD